METPSWSMVETERIFGGIVKCIDENNTNGQNTLLGQY